MSLPVLPLQPRGHPAGNSSSPCASTAAQPWHTDSSQPEIRSWEHRDVSPLGDALSAAGTPQPSLGGHHGAVSSGCFNTIRTDLNSKRGLQMDKWHTSFL